MVVLLIGVLPASGRDTHPAVIEIKARGDQDVSMSMHATALQADPSARCPTGRDVADFVPEGYRVKVTDGCIESEPNPGMRPRVHWPTVADGEVSVEAQVVEGVTRARISLSVRMPCVCRSQREAR